MEENIPMAEEASVVEEVKVDNAEVEERNPFDQFTSFAQNLKEDHTRLQEENKRLLELIDNSSRRERGLVEDNDFLRQQYKQSSEAAFNLSKENQEQSNKIQLLENQLTVGLSARENFQINTLNEMSKRLEVLKSQRQLDLESNERSQESNTRERAGMYTELRSQYEDLRKEYMSYVSLTKLQLEQRDQRSNQLELRIQDLEKLTNQ
ncbi:P-loop containing nucleoside triphosphate hydrolase protein [Wallemia mellicola]|nr:P-loop containing nucleoside triphosphate hydrolase protein [Wallemia mellicola]